MTASVDGVGTVLEDANGDALYSPSENRDDPPHRLVRSDLEAGDR